MFVPRGVSYLSVTNHLRGQKSTRTLNTSTSKPQTLQLPHAYGNIGTQSSVAPNIQNELPQFLQEGPYRQPSTVLDLPQTTDFVKQKQKGPGKV